MKIISEPKEEVIKKNVIEEVTRSVKPKNKTI